MQTETTMGAALKRAGLDPNVAALRVALAKFVNNGGSYEVGLAELKAACEIPDKGRIRSAREGQAMVANVRQPNGDDGAIVLVPRGQSATGQKGSAPSSSPKRDAGASGPVPQGQKGIAPASRPVREPTRVEREAMATARKGAAKAILLIDGTDVRDFTVGQALTAGRQKRKESYLLGVIGGSLKHLPHTTRIGDVLGDDDLMKHVRQAEAFANA